MFRNLSVIALLPQNVIFLFANANIPPSQQLKFNLSRMIRPLNFTSYAIPLALNNMMTACFPFSQKDVCHFIFQLLKPPSLKLSTLFSADEKNSFIALKFCMIPLSCESTAYSLASLSRPLVLCQSQLSSFNKYSTFSVLSILTILLDKCQTKFMKESH